MLCRIGAHTAGLTTRRPTARTNGKDERQGRTARTNGKDERFHRTLKAEVLNGRSFATQQHVQQELDRWRTVYNCERPHEEIGNGHTHQPLPAEPAGVSIDPAGAGVRPG
ncbi:transposase [Paraburkholderia sediminicola]|nr:transposase [Paraburkholderia sediminicola]